MNVPASLKGELIEFLHESFPNSRTIPANEMDKTVQKILQKALSYGLEGETDLATYVITSYVLGENFDVEVPEATKILLEPEYNSHQKASLLETWMRQAVAALEDNPELAQKVGATQAAIKQAQASVDDDSELKAEAQPYRVVADWAIEQLRKGDATSVIKQFSPKFIQQLGMPKVEQVFKEKMLPFFTATEISNSSIEIFTQEAYAKESFAFYFNMMSEKGSKPFIIYIVKEDNQLVVANLALNKTYADTHSRH